MLSVSLNKTFHSFLPYYREDGTVKFLTKGDNNSVDDRGLYAPGQLWLEKRDVVGRARGWEIGFISLVFVIVVYPLSYFPFQPVARGWEIGYISLVFVSVYPLSYFLFQPVARGWEIGFISLVFVIVYPFNYFPFQPVARGWEIGFISLVFVIVYPFNYFPFQPVARGWDWFC